MGHLMSELDIPAHWNLEIEIDIPTANLEDSEEIETQIIEIVSLVIEMKLLGLTLGLVLNGMIVILTSAVPNILGEFSLPGE